MVGSTEPTANRLHEAETTDSSAMEGGQGPVGYACDNSHLVILHHPRVGKAEKLQ